MCIDSITACDRPTYWEMIEAAKHESSLLRNMEIIIIKEKYLTLCNVCNVVSNTYQQFRLRIIGWVTFLQLFSPLGGPFSPCVGLFTAFFYVDNGGGSFFLHVEDLFGIAPPAKIFAGAHECSVQYVDYCVTFLLLHYVTYDLLDYSFQYQ